MIFVKTEIPAVCAATARWWRCRNAGIVNKQRGKKMCRQNKQFLYRDLFHMHMWMWGSRLCLDEVFPVYCAPNGTCRNVWLRYPLQSQQALFAAQHNFCLDNFTTNAALLFFRNCELYFGQVPGMWLCPRCTCLNRRKEKISVVTNYLNWHVCHKELWTVCIEEMKMPLYIFSSLAIM